MLRSRTTQGGERPAASRAVIVRESRADRLKEGADAKVLHPVRRRRPLPWLSRLRLSSASSRPAEATVASRWCPRRGGLREVTERNETRTGPPRPAPRSATVARCSVARRAERLWLPGPVIPNPLGCPKDLPLQPWARALVADRQTHRLEPHARCKPSGGARVFLTPYGVEIAEFPELQRCSCSTSVDRTRSAQFTQTVARIPRTLEPTYYGHSIGWWEADTLVVDTVGFNEGFWCDRSGLPHTNQLRTLERFTRAQPRHAAVRADARRSWSLYGALQGQGRSALGTGKRAVRVTSASRPTTRTSSWSGRGRPSTVAVRSSLDDRTKPQSSSSRPLFGHFHPSAGRRTVLRCSRRSAGLRFGLPVITR